MDTFLSFLNFLNLLGSSVNFLEHFFSFLESSSHFLWCCLNTVKSFLKIPGSILNITGIFFWIYWKVLRSFGEALWGTREVHWISQGVPWTSWEISELLGKFPAFLENISVIPKQFLHLFGKFSDLQRKSLIFPDICPNFLKRFLNFLWSFLNFLGRYLQRFSEVFLENRWTSPCSTNFKLLLIEHFANIMETSFEVPLKFD